MGTMPDEEAAMKRALIGRAAETVVLASPEKLGAVSPCLIAPLGDASTLITDRGIPRATLQPFERRGLRVIRA